MGAWHRIVPRAGHFSGGARSAGGATMASAPYHALGNESIILESCRVGMGE
jgi:hypothetical protein